MRIYVDGKIILRILVHQEIVFKRLSVALNSGFRTFVVEYYDHVGNAVAHVSLKGDPGDYGNTEPAPGGAGLIIDNNSPNFQWGGPPDNRFVSRGGYGTNFFWTYNTNQSAVNYGRWYPHLSEAGNYEVFVYVPGDRTPQATPVTLSSILASGMSGPLLRTNIATTLSVWVSTILGPAATSALLYTTTPVKRRSRLKSLLMPSNLFKR